jgi:hypothetical protein
VSHLVWNLGSHPVSSQVPRIAHLPRKIWICLDLFLRVAFQPLNPTCLRLFLRLHHPLHVLVSRLERATKWMCRWKLRRM